MGLGLPLRLDFDREWLQRRRQPLLLVHGEADEFASGEEMAAFVEGLDQGVDLRRIPGADHLFTGQENRAVDAVVSYLGAA